MSIYLLYGCINWYTIMAFFAFCNHGLGEAWISYLWYTMTTQICINVYYSFVIIANPFNDLCILHSSSRKSGKNHGVICGSGQNVVCMFFINGSVNGLSCSAFWINWICLSVLLWWIDLNWHHMCISSIKHESCPNCGRSGNNRKNLFLLSDFRLAKHIAKHNVNNV
jgi:hypothetical protein